MDKKLFQDLQKCVLDCRNLCFDLEIVGIAHEYWQVVHVSSRHKSADFFFCRVLSFSPKNIWEASSLSSIWLSHTINEEWPVSKIQIRTWSSRERKTSLGHKLMRNSQGGFITAFTYQLPTKSPGPIRPCGLGWTPTGPST